MKPRNISAVLVFVLLAAGCGTGDAPEPAQVEKGELDPVPYPDTSSLEVSVREQLDDARSRLENLMRVPEVDEADLAGVYGETGMNYHAYSLRQAASACYRHAQRLSPGDFRWPYYLGHLSRTDGRLEEALSSFERALEIRPDALLALLHLGHVAAELEQVELAAAVYQRALNVDAGCAEAGVGLGKIALSRHDFATAVRQLEQARRMAPEATEINYPLGMAYRGLGDKEQATKLLAQRGEVPARTDDPWMRDIANLKEGMRVHQIRGSEFYQHGHYKEALVEFRKAVEASPGQAVAHLNLGLTLAQTGDLDGACRELEQAVRLEPGNDVAQYNLGRLFAELGRDDEAARHYEASLEANPNRLQAHFNLGNTLRRLGRFDESVGHYRTVVERDPGHAQARLAEAYALLRLHRYAEARQRLEEAHIALPDDRDVIHVLARVLSAAPEDTVRDGPKAMGLAKLLMTPQIPFEHVVTLAMVLAENGAFGEAVRLQQRAIAVQEQTSSTTPLNELRENLARYRTGQRCRRPWTDDDPELSPR